ncbi:hypothetical protein BDN72DRAFT_918005 [Pluteus cervinus]|uniref:Uncharacterized protein n=1 Tax=Pluteus cervinus TaxID=181527 RepID=A0ACD2ZX71_9AGAR|nr:hypothetical protein BDN72DRAFT_918005 [Pluteus cervinus]
MRHARFFSCNVVTLEIRTGYEGSTNPHPVGCIGQELASWLAQLQELQEVTLPRFWLTTHVSRALSQLPRLLRVLYSHMHGGGNPLDTLNFKPISDPGVDSEIFFPSLVILYQNAPFSQITQFISSWKGSSNLVDLTLASQLLETPDSFRSALLVITDRCPLLLGLGLTSLITPYLDHPRAAPSRLRITLDDLLPLLKLNHLHSLDISHALPLALTNDDFLVLIRGWPGMERLCLGSDPYPLDSRIVHVARSPLSLSPTHNADGPDPANAYPILGLWHAIRSLRIYCPYLTGLFLFGIDDFPTPDEQARITADEPPPNPFPYLTTVSFSMSLLTSEKTSVALALSQYLLPDTTLTPNKPWGGDQDSEYLSHLNLKPLFSSYDQLSGELQEVMDSAEPTLPEPLSSFSPSLTLDEPIGFNGVLDEETDAELERRVLLWDGVAEFLPVLSRARRDERIKADKVMFSW